MVDLIGTLLCVCSKDDVVEFKCSFTLSCIGRIQLLMYVHNVRIIFDCIA